MLGSLAKAAFSALLGALGKVALLLYERLWGDAARWRTYTVWRARQEGKVESERDRLKAADRAIQAEPDKTGKDLQDDVNDTFRPR